MTGVGIPTCEVLASLRLCSFGVRPFSDGGNCFPTAIPWSVRVYAVKRLKGIIEMGSLKVVSGFGKDRELQTKRQTK